MNGLGRFHPMERRSCSGRIARLQIQSFGLLMATEKPARQLTYLKGIGVGPCVRSPDGKRIIVRAVVNN